MNHAGPRATKCVTWTKTDAIASAHMTNVTLRSECRCDPRGRACAKCDIQIQQHLMNRSDPHDDSRRQLGASTGCNKQQKHMQRLIPRRTLNRIAKQHNNSHKNRLIPRRTLNRESTIDPTKDPCEHIRTTPVQDWLISTVKQHNHGEGCTRLALKF